MASANLDYDTVFTKAEIGPCLPDLRAYARILAVEREHADRLVRKTVLHAQRVTRRSRGAISVLVELFAILHDLHYAPPHIRVAPPRDGGNAGFDVAFWDLVDEQREVLLLRAAFDLSIEQIAGICDCSLAMIETRLAEARGALMWSYGQPSEADGARLIIPFTDRRHGLVNPAE